MKDVKDEDYKKMMSALASAVRVIKPSLTEAQAENVVINVANYIQLDRLKTSISEQGKERK